MSSPVPTIDVRERKEQEADQTPRHSYLGRDGWMIEFPDGIFGMDTPGTCSGDGKHTKWHAEYPTPRGEPWSNRAIHGQNAPEAMVKRWFGPVSRRIRAFSGLRRNSVPAGGNRW